MNASTPYSRKKNNNSIQKYVKDALVRANFNTTYNEKEKNKQINTQVNDKESNNIQKKTDTDNTNIESHTELDFDPYIPILASLLDEQIKVILEITHEQKWDNNIKRLMKKPHISEFRNAH